LLQLINERRNSEMRIFGKLLLIQRDRAGLEDLIPFVDRNGRSTVFFRNHGVVDNDEAARRLKLTKLLGSKFCPFDYFLTRFFFPILFIRKSMLNAIEAQKFIIFFLDLCESYLHIVCVFRQLNSVMFKK